MGITLKYFNTMNYWKREDKVKFKKNVPDLFSYRFMRVPIIFIIYF